MTRLPGKELRLLVSTRGQGKETFPSGEHLNQSWDS